MDMIEILTLISNEYLRGNIRGKFCSDLMEGLIRTNLNVVPELEEFADFLAHYHPEPDPKNPGLLRDTDLRRELRRRFRL